MDDKCLYRVPVEGMGNGAGFIELLQDMNAGLPDSKQVGTNEDDYHTHDNTNSEGEEEGDDTSSEEDEAADDKSLEDEHGAADRSIEEEAPAHDNTSSEGYSPSEEEDEEEDEIPEVVQLDDSDAQIFSSESVRVVVASGPAARLALVQPPINEPLPAGSFATAVQACNDTAIVQGIDNIVKGKRVPKRKQAYSPSETQKPVAQRGKEETGKSSSPAPLRTASLNSDIMKKKSGAAGKGARRKRPLQ